MTPIHNSDAAISIRRSAVDKVTHMLHIYQKIRAQVASLGPLLNQPKCKHKLEVDRWIF